MLFQKLGPKWGIQWRRIRPSQHLLLGARIIERVEIFAKTVDQIALGHQDEDRETNVKFPLNNVQLARDLGGFALHLFRRILDQTFHWDCQQQSVDRAVVTMLSQKAEELPPFACCARFYLLENQPSGGVEND